MLFVKCCCICNRLRFSKNVIYVKMYGKDKTGNYCIDCVKDYLRSTVMEIQTYIEKIKKQR